MRFIVACIAGPRQGLLPVAGLASYAGFFLRLGRDGSVVADVARIVGTERPGVNGRSPAVRTSSHSWVAPVAERLGCARELASISDLMARGVPYQRLQDVFHTTGSLTEVTRSLIRDLRTSYV